MKKSTKVAGILGAVAVTALGAYFYSKTSTGKKQVAKLKTKATLWANHAKRDILKRVKELKQVNRTNYHKVVDAVMKKYKAVKKLAPHEISVVSKELKKHWNNAKKDITAKIKDDILG